MAGPFVSLRGLSKAFGAVKAVDDVTLEIERGEIFCLLGGSGCGKSTLLRMLAGFEEPSSGAIWIDGQDQAGVPPYQRPTNMMFQSYALFPHMSVERNIAYGLKRDGLPRSEIASRVLDILALVQMSDLAKRKPHQLSGGQRQRVALARALVKNPKLLLLDEPLGALDKKLREETQFELLKIQETLGVTFVVVTHDQEEAMTLSSRIGVMNAGRIVQIGSPREIYEFPQSRFVADFIGSVNLFDGRVAQESEAHTTITSNDAGFEIFVSHGISCHPGQNVSVAVRPEKIQLSETALEGCRNQTTGTVSQIAYMGQSSILHIDLATGKRVRVTEANASRHEEAWRVGEGLHLGWAEDAAVVLTS